VIKEILEKQQLGQATVKGWLKTRRDSKAGISFLQINDGSCLGNLQVVANNELNNYANILTMTSGCAIEATGELVRSQGSGQAVELQASSVKLIGEIDDPETYPIQPKRHTMEFLRLHPHLRIRTNTFGAIARVRHHLANAIHNFFNDNGYFWVNTPIITTNDCEGAGELFRVSIFDALQANKNKTYADDFFGGPTYLTVSGQLNVETYCCALSKVYTFGPTFRAENSNTSRHLAEFWMIEPELAFGTLKDVILLAQNMLKHVIKHVLSVCSEDMAFFEQHISPGIIARLQATANAVFQQITYTHAIDLLKESKQNFEFPVAWGLDLQSEHERYLAEVLFQGPVIITDYPKEIKSFYMRLNDDHKTVAAMDIIVPGIGEIIGGSAREERYDILQAKMQEMNLGAEYQWYLDLRKYGTVPHGGFGLGFERLLGYITGVANIRDLIPFPRTVNNALF
jgi:asparaginyl-tRNA synthetase